MIPESRIVTIKTCFMRVSSKQIPRMTQNCTETNQMYGTMGLGSGAWCSGIRDLKWEPYYPSNHVSKHPAELPSLQLNVADAVPSCMPFSRSTWQLMSGTGIYKWLVSHIARFYILFSGPQGPGPGPAPDWFQFATIAVRNGRMKNSMVPDTILTR